MPVTTATTQVLASLAATLRREANEAHAQYPQYAGHWDSWRVAEITRRVVSKGRRVAFEAGDLVLVAPETRAERVAPRGKVLPYDEWPQVTFATAYSRRNGVDTGVRADWVREVQVTD